MNDYEKLKQQVEDLTRRLGDMELKMAQRSEFQDTFSNKQVINHKVQFMQKVTNKTGTTIAN